MSEPSTQLPSIEGVVLTAAPPAIKPGRKTSEFWLVLALLVSSNGMAVAGLLPAEWSVAVSTVSVLAFNLCRQLLKMKVAGFDPMAVLQQIDAPRIPVIAAAPGAHEQTR